jgi:iron(III) transport system ATP-binding protein
MTVLALEKVSHSFDNTLAVKDVNLTVESGEVVCLLGPSASGKTTILRLVAGLEELQQGRVTINHLKIVSKGIAVPPEKRGVGMVFQDYALFPHLSVFNNVSFGLNNMNKEEKRRRTEEILAQVGLQGLGDRFPHQLSGGQQQRVALARALAPHPVLHILDEPFSNLDADMRTKIREDVYRILKTIGITAILVTHDQDEAFSLADRIAVLNQGRIEQVGTPEEVYHKPETRFVADFVGETDFVAGTIVSGGIDTALGLFSKTILGACGKKGDTVEVMIRPDDIEMELDEKGNCKVIQRRFKGSENIYTLRFSSGQMVKAVKPSTFILPDNTRVRAWANPDHIVIFRPDESIQCQIFDSKKNLL